ncbi:hypothetical protein PHAVU_011G006300 [Phaseolus vulgaris]|uniref:DUF7610 domain-containing protein n=1 Tax=Phaseolus vulgaris TaxID=3885 RepID=V7ACU4_PHAVU|nr:hypothetical protein PHAVU_011G006300g [Phaseolus vulgaris]ESW03342.1 hypothetical protein PHAVU_011G006300g [Phaseolus vulgaris]
MTKSYKKLQGKLEELQCMLDEALLLGPETHSHHSISSGIKQKLAFINTILYAEASSHGSQPHDLQQISERLSTLEMDFNNWDSFRSELPGHDMDKDSTLVNDETGLVVFEEPEKGCVHSDCEKGMVEDVADCDEEEKERGEVKNGSEKLVTSDYEEAEEFFEEFEGEKEVVELEGGDLEGEERRFGKRCAALACGVVIGMILMAFIIFIIFMLNASHWFHYAEDLSFAVPT